MAKPYFAVITGVPEQGRGNYSTAEAYIDPNADPVRVGSNIIVNPPTFNETLFGKAVVTRGIKTIDLTVEQIVFCSVPVFYLGELLVMDACTGRTIPDGRKPDKYDVTYERFEDLDKAIDCAREVMK